MAFDYLRKSENASLVVVVLSPLVALMKDQVRDTIIMRYGM